MTIKESIEAKRVEIRRIAESHGASNIRLFGSVARGESRPDSDIDFLIDVKAETSSWFPVGLIQDLEKLLGLRVEIVTERSLNANLRKTVLGEAVPI